ncbi:MAG: hypothetical protein QM536_08600, partial [Chitinophagaceae bacterium]|nr:hypothetical protein [Chitinophagaceae bacterium]
MDKKKGGDKKRFSDGFTHKKNNTENKEGIKQTKSKRNRKDFSNTTPETKRFKRVSDYGKIDKTDSNTAFPKRERSFSR